MALAEASSPKSAGPKTAGVQPCPKWGPMTPADLLAQQVQKNPDRPLFVRESGEALSYWQFDAHVSRLAAMLQSMHLRPGDCVLIRQGRRVEGVVAVLAALRAGLDSCLIPQTMSAREASHGSRALLPKGVIEAGDLPPGAEPASVRVMEIAANLFTVRFVAGFGDVCDGMTDIDDAVLMEALPDEDLADAKHARAADDPCLIHTLRPGPSGRIDRITRTASGALSQGLACAMALQLSARSTLGLPFDPGGPVGFFTAVLPALMVGARVELFNALDPLVADHITFWSSQSETRTGYLPHAVYAPPKPEEQRTVGKVVWIAQSAGRTVAAPDQVLVDVGGFAYLPALPKGKRLSLSPGDIDITGASGLPMRFGKVGLSGQLGAHEAGTSLLSGELTVEGPIAALAEHSKRTARHTGQPAQVTQSGGLAPQYTLAPHDATTGPMVGGQPVMMAAINRSLSLTGRWEDAAAFA
ncbi:MAG: acyl--CoA ligase, partial [Devosiaceae bacterium]|nr:acyl--CoA ligase [Devosiaceae bacterium MH13]